MKNITSRENPLFKKLIKLSQSTREIKKQNLIFLEGIHLVKSYYDQYGTPDAIILSESGELNNEINTLLKALPTLEPLVFKDTLFNELSSLTTPSNIIAIAPIPETKKIEDLHLDFGLVCENIQDPGNLGSILRSAAAAGAEHVFLSSNSVSAWSTKVLRSAQGAHFSIQIHEDIDVTELLRKFNGKIIATSPTATVSIFDVNLTQPFLLLVGNEGAGLSEEILKLATDPVSIPMPGKIESLNVAVAASICLFERVRQTRRSITAPD